MDTCFESGADEGASCQQCSCGITFLETDPDVSVTLQKCATCFSTIQSELIRQDDIAAVGSSAVPSVVSADTPNGAGDDITNGAGDDAPQSTVDDAPLDAEDAAPLREPRSTGPICMELISGLMMSAMSDKMNLFTLPLNGKEETFILDPDPFSNSNARKLFCRASWPYSSLYSRDIYGGMYTAKSAIVTPCVVMDKSGKHYVLMALGKTLCNRPRIDGLVISLQTFEASFAQHIMSFVKSYLFNEQFDGERMNRYIALHVCDRLFF